MILSALSLCDCRYSSKHADLMQRRIECRESVLRKTIERLCKQRQHNLSVERRDELTQRLVVEMVEFLTPRKPDASAAGGRVSGSLSWRLERGETTLSKDIVIRPTKSELEALKIRFQYSCASDKYVRSAREW